MRLSEKKIFQTLMVHHNFPSSNHHLLGITVYSIFRQTEMVWFFNHSFLVASSHFQLNLCPWRGSFFSRPRATACRDTCSLPRRRGVPGISCLGMRVAENHSKSQRNSGFLCGESKQLTRGSPVRCWWFYGRSFMDAGYSWFPQVDSCLFWCFPIIIVSTYQASRSIGLQPNKNS